MKLFEQTLVKADSGILNLAMLNGRRVGLASGTTSIQNLEEALEKYGATFIPVIYDTEAEMFAAYEAGEVDGVSNDIPLLSTTAATFDNPDNHRLLNESISKEPLALVIDENQSDFADVVRTVTNTLLQAEEYGINSQNIDKLVADNRDSNTSNDSSSAIRQFLGIEGNLGQVLGLSPDFTVNIIKAVGNYSEIYNRHFDSNILPRGLNALSTDFGLQLPLPQGSANSPISDIADITVLKNAESTVIDLNSIFTGDSVVNPTVMITNNHADLVEVTLDGHNLIFDYQADAHGFGNIILQGEINGHRFYDRVGVTVKAINKVVNSRGGLNINTSGLGDRDDYPVGLNLSIEERYQNNVVYTSDARDILETGDGDDIVNTSGGDDDINSGAGDDIIRAGGGDDDINGGAGKDIIRAGGSDDDINGGAGSDIIRAGDGNDNIRGGKGADLLIGGRGLDTFIIKGDENFGAYGPESDLHFDDRGQVIIDFIVDFNDREDVLDLQDLRVNGIGSVSYHSDTGNVTLTETVNGEVISSNVIAKLQPELNISVHNQGDGDWTIV